MTSQGKQERNCATDDRKLPIDRPCSACSAGDYKMEYHDHCPPFREGKQELGAGGTELTLDDFRNQFPELFKLWRSAPFPLGIDNESAYWLKFAEYVRTHAPAAPEAPVGEIKADTLFGIYCEGNAEQGLRELGKVNWDAWQRLADWLNGRAASSSRSTPHASRVEIERGIAEHIRNAAGDGCVCEPCQAARDSQVSEEEADWMRAAAKEIRINIYGLEKGSGPTGADNPANQKWLESMIHRDAAIIRKHWRSRKSEGEL